MEHVFTYSSPCLEYALAKKFKKKFHINYNVDKYFLESFFDNTNKTFLECVYNYLHLHYNNLIGISFYFDENGRTPYIYILVDLNDNTNKIIKNIINDLEIEYNNHWIKHRLPKLITILKNKLKSPSNLDLSVKCFQNKYGYDRTQQALYVFYNQIMWYYDDLSFRMNRHKYTNQ